MVRNAPLMATGEMLGLNDCGGTALELCGSSPRHGSSAQVLRGMAGSSRVAAVFAASGRLNNPALLSHIPDTLLRYVPCAEHGRRGQREPLQAALACHVSVLLHCVNSSVLSLASQLWYIKLKRQ